MARLLDQCLAYISSIRASQTSLATPPEEEPSRTELDAIAPKRISLNQPFIESTIQLKKSNTNLEGANLVQMRVTSITLPNSTPTPITAEQRQSKVMIVEDNIINRKILMNYMKKANRMFATAANGLEALQLYQETPEAFSIILMDISMPVMDGLTATREIRQFESLNGLARTRVVALTCFSSQEYQREAALSGVDMFLVCASSLPLVMTSNRYDRCTVY